MITFLLTELTLYFGTVDSSRFGKTVLRKRNKIGFNATFSVIFYGNEYALCLDILPDKDRTSE